MINNAGIVKKLMKRTTTAGEEPADVEVVAKGKAAKEAEGDGEKSE